MSVAARETGGPAARHIVLLLVSAAGLALCITLVFLGMRAVMDIGGACASGGPFVPVRPCPAGVPLLMTVGIFGLFGFGALGFYAGARVGGAWAALPLLAWPGLFLSLGWNFLEYGFWPPSGSGWDAAWLFCGVIFVLMGGIPLIIGVWSLDELSRPNKLVPRRYGVPLVPGVPGGRSPRAVSEETADPSAPDASAGPVSSDVLVDRLERLAALRRRGDLTNEEYETAKAALLGSVGESSS